MSQINRPPLGLQSLLASKNFGVNPNDLSQQVMPTLETFPFFSIELIDYERVTAILTATGQSTTISVPEGELWLIMRISLEVAINASGDVNRWVLFLSGYPNEAASGSPFRLAASERKNPVGVADQTFVVYQANPLLPAYPGTEIGAEVTQFIPTGLAEIYPELLVQYVRLAI